MADMNERAGDNEQQRPSGNGGMRATTYTEVEAVLAVVDFPASRDELVSSARQAETDDDVAEAFETLPDRQYADRDDVHNAMREASGQGEA